MTTSTKQEVHNARQRERRRTEPCPQATCVINLVKFSNVVFEICKQTYKHRLLIAVLRIPPGSKVTSEVLLNFYLLYVAQLYVWPITIIYTKW